MKNSILVIIIALIIAAIIAGYVIFQNNYGVPATTSPTGTLVPSPTPTSPKQQTDRTQVIIMRNIAFIPALTTIKKGTTITWDNQDTVVHNVVDDPDGNNFKSGFLQPGEKFSFTFEKIGDYLYHCSIHPSMRAKITVIE
jgi:plastocyanin